MQLVNVGELWSELYIPPPHSELVFPENVPLVPINDGDTHPLFARHSDGLPLEVDFLGTSFLMSHVVAKIARKMRGL